MTTILERIAAGDERAVDDCVREYGGLVWRLARRHLDAAPAELEDAVQDIFVEIWLSAARYDASRGREPAFVATLAHRRLIDRQREFSARTRNHTRAASEAPARTPPPVDPDAHESNAVLLGAFNDLPDSEREALWMSIYGGLSHREIGIATQSPIGTVKSRLRRALLRLSDVLARSSVRIGEGAS